MIPIYWLFATLLGIALFRLRRLDPGLERPYQVIFYPFTPILFCASCGFLFYSSFTYALSQDSAEAAWTLVFFFVGIAVSFLSQRPPAKPP